MAALTTAGSEDGRGRWQEAINTRPLWQKHNSNNPASECNRNTRCETKDALDVQRIVHKRCTLLQTDAAKQIKHKMC
jgi:hypothetical protein